jgi:predicted nuclease with TOPRIM domain
MAELERILEGFQAEAQKKQERIDELSLENSKITDKYTQQITQIKSEFEELEKESLMEKQNLLVQIQSLEEQIAKGGGSLMTEMEKRKYYADRKV